MAQTVRSLARSLYAIVVVILGFGCLVIGAALVFGDHAMWARLLGIGVMVCSFFVYRASYRTGNRLFGSSSER